MPNLDLNKIQLWGLIPMAKRMELRNKYKIVPTGRKEVVNNQLVMDGVEIKNLEEVPTKELENAIVGVEKKSTGQKNVAKKIKESRKKEEEKKVNDNDKQNKTENKKSSAEKAV